MKNLKNIEFSTSNYIVIIVSITLLLISWGYIVAFYSYLPETIAIHFNGAGEPDGYGSKNSVWLAPVIFTLLSVAMIYGAKFPTSFNFSIKIQTQKQLKTSSNTLLFSSLLLSFVLLLITHSVISASIETKQNYKWVFPVLLIAIAIFIIIIFYMHLISKKND